MTRDRPEERWAEKCVRHALKGTTVEQHDDGSQPGMPDLLVRYPDGHTAAVEVTRSVDSDATALWRVIGHPGRWIDESLQGGWTVRVRPKARGKVLRSRLPILLRQLEADGVVTANDRGPGELARTLRDLGLEDVHQSGTDFPGSIYPFLALPSEQATGFVPETAESLVAWVQDWIVVPRRSDNLAKLARSGADERHLFIVIDAFGEVPFEVTDLLMRDEAPVPERPTQLPPELTDVWIMSTWTSGHGVRCSSRELTWAPFVKAVGAESEH